MNLLITLLAIYGIIALLFFVFCFGIIYEASQINTAAKNGITHKLPGYGIVRITLVEDTASDEPHHHDWKE